MTRAVRTPTLHLERGGAGFAQDRWQRRQVEGRRPAGSRPTGTPTGSQGAHLPRGDRRQHPLHPAGAEVGVRAPADLRTPVPSSGARL